MEAIIRRLEQGSMLIACLCVTVMMLVVCVDAAGRYLVRAPLPWAFELVSFYLMVGAAYFALSPTYQQGDHINIEIVRARLPQRLRAYVDATTSILAALLFAAIACTAFEKCVEAYVNREFSPGYILWPVWLSFVPIPLGSALLVLRLVHHAVMLIALGEDRGVREAGDAGGAE